MVTRRAASGLNGFLVGLVVMTVAGCAEEEHRAPEAVMAPSALQGHGRYSGIIMPVCLDPSAQYLIGCNPGQLTHLYIASLDPEWMRIADIDQRFSPNNAWTLSIYFTPQTPYVKEGYVLPSEVWYTQGIAQNGGSFVYGYAYAPADRFFHDDDSFDPPNVERENGWPDLRSVSIERATLVLRDPFAGGLVSSDARFIAAEFLPVPAP